jgi:hypothetical protein
MATSAKDKCNPLQNGSESPVLVPIRQRKKGEVLIGEAFAQPPPTAKNA